METDIRYLDLLEQDLRRAADYEVAQRHDQAVPRRRQHWVGIAAGLVAFLLIAGLVGLVAGNNGGYLRSLAGKVVGEGTQAPTAGTPGKAASGSGGNRQLDALHQPDLGVNWEANGAPAAPVLNGSKDNDLTKIIRKGDISLTLARDGLGAAVDEVTAIADEKNGFVFSSSVGERAGSMVLRVPAEQFDATVTALRALGTVKDVTISSQDVTADFIDLNARLKIARGRRHVLQGLYAQATTIEQTVRVLNALNDTQTRIEQMQGQLNVIDNQTSQSTIRVSLREEGLPDLQTQDVRNPSVGTAWDRAVAGFFGVISAVVIGVGYLVPIAILALLVLLVVTLVRRRRAASQAP
jgi:hypothetical protein